MVNTTAADTTISGMIGIYYSKVFEKRLEANLVFDKWGEQRPIICQPGTAPIRYASLSKPP